MSSAANETEEDAGKNPLAPVAGATTEEAVPSERESALRLANEKSRNFLNRMKELTQINRSLSDQNSELKEDNDRLISALSLNKTATERLKEEVDECRSDKVVMASLETEVEDLRKQIHHNGLTIKRLTAACEEKNRRIDLLAHRKQQRQQGGESWKEGCDGYRSSESPSLDSESSASVATTSDELTCEDLFLAEDFQLRYRRLLNEKLALEKVHSEAQLLVSQLKDENKDYRKKIKSLTDSLQELKDQLLLAEVREEDLQVKLEEVQLENEQLEFQVLEIEVQKEEELECARTPGSQKSPTEQTLSKTSNSPEAPSRPLKPDLEETTEARSAPDGLTEKPESSGVGDLSSLHAATPKLEDLSIIPKDINMTHGGDDGLEPAAAGAAASDSQSTKKPQKVTITANRAHLGRASIGLDKTHVEPSSSELAAMITPPESKSLKFRGLDSSGTMTSFSDDFDFRDKSIDSDDSLWATVEDPANATNLESRRSSEFWKEVEKRMGFNVDDITLILEFDDSFPSEVDDASARHTSQDSAPLSDHDDDSFALPPPLPLSLPPVEVEHDTSPSERSMVEASQDVGISKHHDFLQVEVAESLQKSGVLQENGVGSLTVDSKSESKSALLDDQLLQWIDGDTTVGHLHDNGKDFASYESEIVTLKRHIVDLEKQLSAAQDECLTVIRSKENVLGDFERMKKTIDEKDRDMKLVRKEFETLLSERNSQIAAESDRSRLMTSQATQTADDENLAKLERLLQTKDRELTAKANEADNLSREMREWQRKVTMAGERDQETVELLNSIRKELESMILKEREARMALEEVLEREKRLQVEKDRLEESVAKLQVEVVQREAIAREKEIVERKMDELEHNLRLKSESESSLLQEIASLKHRVDDLQSSLKLLQQKDWDFQSLEQKYENLGNLTRRLQTAVAPMKSRIARLALRCKTKDVLIRKMLNALRRHGNGESSLEAEIEREVMGTSTDDYTRPLSPLTISHLDQINHEILKLDLLSNDKAFSSLFIPSNSHNNVFGEFPGNMTLRDAAGDIRQTSVMPESQATRYIDDTPPNLVSMLSRRHVTLLDSGDFDNVKHSGEMRTGRVTDNFANSDYRLSSVARISEENAEDGRFSTGKGHALGRFLHGENTDIGTVNTETQSAKAFTGPEPPGDFHVEKVSGNGSVLLGWRPPVTDDLAQRGGSAVAGYKVYVNGREALFVSSHLATKVLLRSINLNAVPLCFTLRTVTERGDISQPVDIYLDHTLLKKCLTHDFVESVADDDVVVLSATSNPSRPDVNGHRKMFLAIYDYHPSAPTRVEGQGAELSFQTGDIIVTYGPMRSDGYYVGKVRGRRGLVPGSFIEELAPFTSQDVKTVTSNGRPVSSLVLTNGIHLTNRRSRSVGAELKMAQSKPA